MTKTELSKAVAGKLGTTIKQASEIVDATINVITETLANGDEVNLVGFGKFKVTDRAARTARNPQTGEPITVPASKSPKFSAGKALKDAVKGAK